MSDRVLVTGGDGFVGKHVRQALQEYEVFTASHDPRPDPRHLQMDITVEDQVQVVIREVEPKFVIHLAAVTSVADSWNDPGLTMRVNVVGSSILFRGLQQYGRCRRILSVGSSEEYGSSSEILTEESVLEPQNPYGVSKMAQGLLARQWAVRFGLPVIHVRPFNHVGRGQRLGFLFSDWASQIAEVERGLRQPVLKTRSTTAVKDFLNVRDVVEAYRLLLTQGQVGEVYNVCSQEGVNLESLAQKFISLCKASITLDSPSAQGHPYVQVGSCAKLQRDTGWAPKVSLNDSLLEVIDEWRGLVGTAGDE